MPAKLIEARAILVEAPLVPTGIYRKGADGLRDFGIETDVVNLPWGRFNDLGRVRKPLDESVARAIAEPENNGLLFL